MTKEQIIQKMKNIRSELNDMAVKRGDLEWEYRSLNQELGVIENAELKQNKTASG